MTIEIRQIEPGRSRAVTQFISFAHEIYATDPAWVAPLHSELRQRLDPRRNPFFEHAEVALFTASRNGKLVGRMSAQIDRQHLDRHNDGTGYFGFFDTIDDVAVGGALLDAGAQWLRQRGMRTMRGPISLSFFDEMGALLEGFEHPPMLLMAHTRNYQARLLTELGAHQVKELWAWSYDPRAPLPARALRAHARTLAQPEVKIRGLRKHHLAEDLKIALGILNESFADHWGAVAMTDVELEKAIAGLSAIIKLDMALLAEIDGEPAALAIALPNINELIADMNGSLGPYNLLRLLWRMRFSQPRTWRLPLFGIKPKFRRSKRYGTLAAALVVEMAQRSRQYGVQECELSWTLEDNALIAAIIRSVGGTIYKRYGVFEKDITGIGILKAG
jgi:hypothetical protein